jgi:hypothetical protein
MAHVFVYHGKDDYDIAVKFLYEILYDFFKEGDKYLPPTLQNIYGINMMFLVKLEDFDLSTMSLLVMLLPIFQLCMSKYMKKGFMHMASTKIFITKFTRKMPLKGTSLGVGTRLGPMN